MAVVASVLWFWLAAAALAHASLTAVTPADGAVVATSPKMLSLSFSEPVSPLVLKLVTPGGQSLALNQFRLADQTLEITPPVDLGSGTYVLTWRVVSEDGHPVGGSTIFSVGAPSAAPHPSDSGVDWPVRGAIWLARIALYVGLFFGIGGAFTMGWMPKAAGRGPIAVPAALLVGLFATILSGGLQGLDALGLPMAGLFDATAWRAGFETSFGATVVVLSLGFLIAFVSLQTRSILAARAASLVALGAGAAALTLSGHASTAPPQWLTRPAVFLHVIIIAIWIGALLPLAWALLNDPESGQRLLRQFSRLIPLAVAILVLAGTILAVIQVQKPAALLSTAYGRALLTKLGLLVALFAVVAVNRWVLTRAAAAGDPRAVRRLAQAIIVETAIVLAIFAVAAAWRFTPPPRALAMVAAPPVSIHIHTDKAMAEVTVTPGHAGVVDFSAIIQSGDFAPLEPKEVTVVLSNPKAGIEPIARKAVQQGDGSWHVDGLLVPAPGAWIVRLDILINDFELVHLQETMDIKP